MRAALALALLAACKQTPTVPCEERATAIETRIRNQTAEVEQLAAITAILDTKTLPPADEGSADFAPGIVIPLGKPTVLEEVANAEACTAIRTKEPAHVYALSTDDAVTAESAAWLAKASKAWGVTIDLRRLVLLPREHDVFPWPASSDAARAMAKRAYAGPVEPNMDELKAALANATKGCNAINEQQIDLIKQHANDQLALPAGLRTCGCSVSNLDELEGIWHAFYAAQTDVGWIPPPDDAKTSRSVSPLSCATAHEPFIVSSKGSWSTDSADPRPVLMGVLDHIGECRDRLELHRSTVVKVTLRSTEPSTTLSADVSTSVPGLQKCFASLLPNYPVAQPSQGSEDVLIYLPPTPAP